MTTSPYIMELQPVATEIIIRKISPSQQETGQTPILALTHGYGPKDDFKIRLGATYKVSFHGFWVNFNGYLSNKKLELNGQASGSDQKNLKHQD